MPPVHWREETLRLGRAVEIAGGNGVWVKGNTEGIFPPRHRDTLIEALAEPSVFAAAERAFRREVHRDGLQLRVTRENKRAPGASLLMELSNGREREGRWRLREVSEIRRAAIVMDDLGQDLEPVRKLLTFPYPLTFSIMPHLRYSRETAEMAFHAGRAIILHMPMEADDFSDHPVGRYGLAVGMPESKVASVLASDLGSVPYAAGVNNHMGSKATSDLALMRELMPLLARRKLFFIDSRTSGASVALEAARRAGVPAFFRSVFLDDRQNVAYTLGQLRLFRRVVERQGIALAIGHPHPSTLAALAEFLPEFAKADIELVPASLVVQLPQAARLTPE